MKNTETSPIDLSAQYALENIFAVSEVMKRAKTFSSIGYVEGSGLILKTAQDFVNKFEEKGHGSDLVQFSKPAKVQVAYRQVDLIIRSEERKKIDILVKTDGVSEKYLPILFSVTMDSESPFIWAENRIENIASENEIRATLGLLSIMEESLSKTPQ